jgi:hypothetical protein
MPVYNVVLSTLMTQLPPFGNNLRPVQSSNLANYSWLINFEGLFGADLLKYNKCYLRYKLASEPSTSMTGGANLGFLALTGITTDKQAANIPAAYIDLLQVESAPVAASSYRFYQNNLEHSYGVQINVPSGTQEVGVRFYNDDAITFQANVPNYVLTLQFVLSNE